MSQFINYSDIIFDAFCLHTKQDEIVNRKMDIIEKIFDFYNAANSSVLFVGFNPAILATQSEEIFVTEVSDRVSTWLIEKNPNIKLFDPAEPRKFDAVIAFDEYLTFAKSEAEQYMNIESLCKISKGLVITTVKDYKNQEFKDREYSQPAIIKNGDSWTAYTEIHDWDLRDKNSFTTSIYNLKCDTSNHQGIFNRRSLYFKQLAKFALDSGASDFLVHKNLMYKSLLKKNYEHVISVHFEN